MGCINIEEAIANNCSIAAKTTVDNKMRRGNKRIRPCYNYIVCITCKNFLFLSNTITAIRVL